MLAKDVLDELEAFRWREGAESPKCDWYALDIAARPSSTSSVVPNISALPAIDPLGVACNSALLPRPIVVWDSFR